MRIHTHTQTCMAHIYGKDGHRQLRPPTNTDEQTNNTLIDIIPMQETHTQHHVRGLRALHHQSFQLSEKYLDG